MRSTIRTGGFNLLEVAVSLGIIIVLLAVLVPALSHARSQAFLDCCAAHQAQLGESWTLYLTDHEGRFPFIGAQPAWHYGGVRFSASTGAPVLDLQRPLNAYITAADPCEVFRCPADSGITDRSSAVGTGRRTAYRSFGSSFRANSGLFDARIAGIAPEPRGVSRREIDVPRSRLVLLGDPLWYEVSAETGRDASWHGTPGGGNLLFLDCSVRFEEILPGTSNQPVMFDVASGER